LGEEDDGSLSIGRHVMWSFMVLLLTFIRKGWGEHENPQSG